MNRTAASHRPCHRLLAASLVAALLVPAFVPTTHAAAVDTVAAADASAKPARWERYASRTKGVHSSSGWSAPAIAGQVIVVAGSDAAANVAAYSAEALGGNAEKSTGNLLLASVPAGMGREQFAEGLEKLPGVADVQPNFIYEADWVPNDPALPEQWGLSKIAARDAWDVTKGAGVTVAVVDTGVDLTHPDLKDRVDTVNDFDFVNADSSAQDDEGHGTHVAGIVAGTANNGVGGAGVAPAAKILPVKVLDRNGSGTSWMVSKGILYAQAKGADVINLSLGGREDDAAIADAIASVKDECVVVAAAGNDGLAGADYPARLPGVLGVAALDSQNRLATFSQFGSGVDIAAPGVGIVSARLGGGTSNPTVTMSGTSMASPFVAGAAALVIAENRTAGRTWTPAQTADRLVKTAQALTTEPIPMLRADKAVSATTTDPDDDIPGVAVGSSLATGEVDAVKDIHDVRYLYLGTGQSISASVSAPEGIDVRLQLFGPGSTTVKAGSPLTASSVTSYPRQLDYTAVKSGWYYVDVVAVQGAGSYSLQWSTSSVGDDGLPGVALPDSPLMGSVDESTDPDDVYAIHLDAGQQLIAETSASAGTDFDLWLYESGATNFAIDQPITGSGGSGSNERFRFTAQTSGDYHLDVNAYSGSGPYKLTWFVAPFQADDDIPGVPAESKAVTGFVDHMQDSDDVYKVWMSAGQTMKATLVYGSAPNDVDLYLFDSSQTTVDSDLNVAESAGEPEASGPSTESITYTATSTGYHFLDVYAYEGSSDYLLDCSVSRSADDDIPGTSLKAGPINDSLGDTTDTDDVYRIYLSAGQGFSASLSGTSSTDYDLRLFAPGSTSVFKDASVAYSRRGSYPEKFQYIAPKSGSYYLQVHAYSGHGSYRLAWSDKTTPRVHRTPTSTYYDLRRSGGYVKWTTSASVTAVNGKPLAGKKLLLQRSANGSSWSTYWYSTTNAAGKISKTLTFKTAQSYYWRWYATSNSSYNGASSSKTKVRVR